MSWTEGTGSLFITEGGNTDRLLLTADKHDNKHFKHINVTLIGDAAFNKELIAQYQERRIGAMERKDEVAANRERRKAQAELDDLDRMVREDVSGRVPNWAQGFGKQRRIRKPD
jgi:hypothetical protein